MVNSAAFGCIPGAGTSVSWFLDFDACCQGTQTQGLQGDFPPDEFVENGAEVYVDTLVRKRPTAPNYLISHSCGGLIAFEMARMLSSGDARLRPVLLLDAATPASCETNVGANLTDLEAYEKLVSIIE